MQCAVLHAASHIINMQQEYIKHTDLFICMNQKRNHSTCSLTKALWPLQVCVCVRVFGGQSGQRRGSGGLRSARAGKEIPQSGAIPNSTPLSPSGGKVYCQLAFVVGLKRFAAVSIKRHRSKETPPTEIPTEEGEQEEENERGAN